VKRPWTSALVVGALSGIACKGAPAARVEAGPTAEASAPPDLPVAAHGEPLPEGSYPRVVVRGADVVRDGQVVGDCASIVDAGRPMRIDGLFASLKETRRAMDASAPTGLVVLSIPPGTSTLCVKSVSQTAAFAGFPNALLAVLGPGGVVGALTVGAVVPLPPGSNVSAPPVSLTVALGAATTVAWRDPGGDVDSVGAGRDLSDRAGAMWQEHSAHRDPSDDVPDQAVVYADDTVDYTQLIRAADALAGVTKAPGARGSPRAFAVTLSLASAPPSGDAAPLVSGTGRIAPEVMRSTVRKRFGVLRGCYEAALSRNAAATGTVTVRFVIGPTGQVVRASDDGSTLTDRVAVQCVVGAMRKMTFPPPSGGGTVEVVYPVRFASK
jgi:TonB family protein